MSGRRCGHESLLPWGTGKMSYCANYAMPNTDPARCWNHATDEDRVARDREKVAEKAAAAEARVQRKVAAEARRLDALLEREVATTLMDGFITQIIAAVAEPQCGWEKEHAAEINAIFAARGLK